MSFDDKTISLLNNVFSEENIRRQNVFVPIFIFIFFKQSDLLDMKFFVARTFDDVVYVSKPISQPKNKFCHQKSLQRKIGLLVKKILSTKIHFVAVNVTKSTYMRKGNTIIGNNGRSGRSEHMAKWRQRVLIGVESFNHSFRITFKDKRSEVEFLGK